MLSCLPITSVGRLQHAGVEYLPHVVSAPPSMPGEPEEVQPSTEETVGTSRKRRRGSAPPSAHEEPRFVPDPFTVTIKNTCRVVIISWWYTTIRPR
ncbi:unnamed protein product [Heligmosomoides polygyrus]|uniref:Uncharacterized protein n=1 Tax=Heligmosomoides polygyrus TaxID=6339 RepID=A0A183FCZ0_HELPZ|nr:unnamed protein product [Heligmosomoides polygyrus]